MNKHIKTFLISNWTPRQKKPLLEWLDKNMVLPAGGSSRGTKWLVDMVPALHEIINKLDWANPATKISVLKSAQQSLTTLCIGFLCYNIAEDPHTVGIVWPNLNLARQYSRNKITKCF